MNRIYALAIALPLALVGCQNIPASTETNVVLCMTALLESGSFDPATLGQLALVTPSCQAVAADALAEILKQLTQNGRLR